jgi:hypothetical protein
MTVKVYFNDGRIEEFPNAYAYWEWGDDEERHDGGFRINSIDRNFTSAVAFVYPSECAKIEITSEECDRVFKRPPREGGISPELWRIFSEINRECKRQDEKWGEQNHEMIAFDYHAIQYRAIAKSMKKQNKKDSKEGRATWDNILLKEVCEAFAETEPKKQRKEMIQVAAVAVQIIECLKRREGTGSEKGN